MDCSVLPSLSHVLLLQLRGVLRLSTATGCLNVTRMQSRLQRDLTILVMCFREAELVFWLARHLGVEAPGETLPSFTTGKAWMSEACGRGARHYQPEPTVAS